MPRIEKYSHLTHEEKQCIDISATARLLIKEFTQSDTKPDISRVTKYLRRIKFALEYHCVADITELIEGLVYTCDLEDKELKNQLYEMIKNRYWFNSEVNQIASPRLKGEFPRTFANLLDQACEMWLSMFVYGENKEELLALEGVLQSQKSNMLDAFLIIIKTSYNVSSVLSKTSQLFNLGIFNQQEVEMMMKAVVDNPELGVSTLLRYVTSQRKCLQESAIKVLEFCEIPEKYRVGLDFLALFKDIPLQEYINEGLARGNSVANPDAEFDYVESFFDNIARARHWEEKYPGCVRKLYDRYGVTQYSRYSDAFLENLITEMDAVDLPTILVLEFRHHYGEKYVPVNTVKYTWLSELVNGSNYVRVLEVSSEAQLINDFARIVETYGSVDSVIFHAHSTSKSLGLTSKEGIEMGITEDGLLSEGSYLNKILKINNHSETTLIYDCCEYCHAFNDIRQLDYNARVIAPYEVNGVYYFYYNEENKLDASFNDVMSQHEFHYQDGVQSEQWKSQEKWVARVQSALDQFLTSARDELGIVI